MTPRDSGVVINTSGGSSTILFLVAVFVSPCLISTRRPSDFAYLKILRNTSLLSALNGVTYITRIFPPGASNLLIVDSIEKTGITAASVFPDPVGATKRQLILRAITGIALPWIVVIDGNPCSLNFSTINWSMFVS
jgi:hypothetical protein